MTRALTSDEKNVLADVVVDAAAWWTHCQAHCGQALAEKNLKDKVARWRPTYEAAKNVAGYQPRAVREAAQQRENRERMLAAIAQAETLGRAKLKALVKELMAEP